MSAEQVKPGYKRTEVGVIPEDWDVCSILDLGQIRTGPFGTLLKAEEYSGLSGVPLISVGEVGYGDFRISEKTPLVPSSVVNRLPQYVLKRGDIVFGRKGAVDRSAMVGEEQEGWFLGSDGIILRPGKNSFAPYLAWQFRRHEVQIWLLQNAVGTTMASLNQVVLGGVKIPFAPYFEQSAIATALSDVDALLAQLDQLIAKKRDLKQAAMQQLLTGQTRLPGFSGEWEVKRLGDVLRFQVGFPFRSDFFNQEGDGFRLVKNRDLKADDQVFFFSGKFDDSYIVVNGDILIGMDGDFLPCLWSKGDALLNQRVGRIIPSPSVSADFLYYMLLEPLKSIEYATSATTVKHLSHGDIEGIECELPGINEQTAIATVLSDMDTELAALEARRDKTRDLKQGMMQELLTGRIRLV